MKSGRQNMILKVIDEHNVETQDELALLLKQEGFEVTQATISRDIKELRLIKVQSGDGTYKYAATGLEQSSKFEIFRRVFGDTVLSVDEAAGLVVVHTMTGSASPAAEAIDEMNMPEIAGCIAGDNTIFVAVKKDGMQTLVADTLRKMILR